MDLTIRILNREPEAFDEIPCCWGEIQIGEDKETFLMPVNYWSLEDYEQQWKEGLEKIKHENISCLVSEFQDPKLGMYVTFYSLHKDKNSNKILIRPHLIIEDILQDLIDEKLLPKNIKDKEFNSKTCYEFIGPCDPSDEGDKWEIDIE